MPTVLLLEDDPLVLTLLVLVFADAGYQVVTELNGEGLAHTCGTSPAVIVVGRDKGGSFDRGWQAAKVLRARHPEARLIMLSTDPTAVQEVGHTARGSLFDAGFCKPCSLAELLHAVTDCYAQRSQECAPTARFCEKVAGDAERCYAPTSL